MNNNKKVPMSNEIKNLFESFSETDFWSIVDLHVHSSFSDGKSPPEELVEQANKNGLKFIAISDHNTLNAYLETDILKSPLVIPAIEFDCWYKGVLVHILGYGIDVKNPLLLSLCAKTKKETEADIVRLFTQRTPQTVINAIHAAGGIAVLAHPACCWCLSLDRFVKSLKKLGLDGLEVYYPYKRHRGIIKFHKISAVRKICKKYSLIPTGGTDNHN